jgi:hypothetical protein
LRARSEQGDAERAEALQTDALALAGLLDMRNLVAKIEHQRKEDTGS